MSRFAFASSPYGNFAVQVAESRGPLTIETFRLTPIGDLTELPVKPMSYLPTVDHLDDDVLRAEAHRQLEARGVMAAPFFHPSPEFTVNRATYTGHLTMSRTRFPGSDKAHTFASLSLHDLTNSAQTKLTAWWDSVRDDIVTPEFLAQHALASARVDQFHRGEAQQRVARDLAKAERELDEAGAAVSAALDALHALNAGARA